MRKRVSFLKVILSICFLPVLSMQIQPCFAAFSLSVDPYEGGYDLRFGKANAQDTKIVKEITIRVTTDIGKQYRIYQRLEKPLTTPDGIEIKRDSFKMYTLINSNSKGTLERIEEFPVMSSDTVLYTSDTAGDGDSFRVIYTLQPTIGQVPGSYHGRLLFILVPIDSTQEQVVGTLNMYVDLSNEGAVEISTETGFKSIRISSGDLDKLVSSHQYPTVQISIKGNLGSRYRIYQSLGDALMHSSAGERFDLSQVAYTVTDSTSGAPTKEGDLSDLKTKALVYASDDLGSSSDIAVVFKPARDFAEQKAGVYTGVINYSLELDSIKTLVEPGYLDSIDVEFDIEPIFRIVASSIPIDGHIALKEGNVVLQFGEVSYKTGTKESKVKIRVESNLNRPYLVTQKITGALQNSEGHVIPKDYFTFELEKYDDTIGTLKSEGEAAIDPDKDTTLFISGPSGESDEFEVTYRLRVTADTYGGNYNTAISYSLSEL